MSRLAVVAVLALVIGACSADGKGATPTTSPDGTGDTTTEVTGQLPPVMAIPHGVTPCRADQLEVVARPSSPGVGILIQILNRSGGPCGLAGFLTVAGQDAAGEWHAVATTPLPRAAVDGDRWTGVSDATLPAVVTLRRSDVADCKAPVALAHYTAIRLVLPREAGAIDTKDFEFDVGGCPLEITAIAGDSGDY